MDGIEKHQGRSGGLLINKTKSMAPKTRSSSSGKAAGKVPSKKPKPLTKATATKKTAARKSGAGNSKIAKKKPAGTAPKTAKKKPPAKAPVRSFVKKVVKVAAPPPPPEIIRPLVTLTLATRRSDLAIKQAELTIARLEKKLPNHAFKMLTLVTTIDQQESWSLSQVGGQGLFTGEIEAAVLDRRADFAVHSAKDLPTIETEGLKLAGYLPREDPRDVLVIREDLPRPGTIATGSPRRRAQLQRQFAKADFVEIRGNVESRLKKIAEGYADSTVLAAAGLNRLGIKEWPGLRFQILPLAVCVPAVGQGAIAVQARPDTAAALSPHLDPLAARAVEFERAVMRLLGGGCHTSFAVHYNDAAVHVFHEACGYQRFAILPHEALDPKRTAAAVMEKLNLEE